MAAYAPSLLQRLDVLDLVHRAEAAMRAGNGELLRNALGVLKLDGFAASLADDAIARTGSSHDRTGDENRHPRRDYSR